MDFGVQNAKMSAKRCEKEAEQSNTKKQREEKAKTKKDKFLLIIFNKLNFKICCH